jgi:hypothetical protein
MGILLGPDFSEWLFGKWHEKWKHHPQPPAFYFTFKKVVSDLKHENPMVLASRFSPATRITVAGEPQVLAKELLEKPDQAAALLSKACMRVFQADSDHRAIARNLDYLAYGPHVQRRAPGIANGVIKTIGNRKPGDLVEPMETES